MLKLAQILIEMSVNYAEKDIWIIGFSQKNPTGLFLSIRVLFLESDHEI